MIAGIAKMTMNDCTSIDQQKSGMQFSVMPGARILKMVAISSAATHNAETSVNVIICAQKSTRLPGSNCGPASGGYANQPASGAALVNTPQYRKMQPPRYIQYPKAFRRGNATFRVPSISGTR